VNVRSLLRSLRKKFFGAAAPRHMPFRHTRDLRIERLEARELLSGTPPTILKVTPPDFTNVGPVNPTITVQYSEAMNNTDVTKASNYLLFNSSGQQITPLNVSYASATNTASVTIPNQLPAGAYTLFVRGDLVHEATGTAALSQPGQLVVANMGLSQAQPPQPGPSTVSTINVAGDGTLNTVTSYALGQSLKSSTPFPPPLLITSADFNGDGINDIAIITHNTDTTPVTNTLDIFDGLGGTSGFAPTPTIELSLPATANPVALLAFSERKTDQTANGVFGPDLAVTDQANGQVIVFKNTTQLNGPTSFGAGKGYAVGKSPVGLVAADFDGDNRLDLAVADQVPDNKGVYSIDVLPGNGNGTFQGFQAFLLDPTDGKAFAVVNPNDLAAGPIDVGNPLPDIAVAGNNGIEVLYDISPSPGTFLFNYAPNTTIPALPIVLNAGIKYSSVAVGQIAQAKASAVDDIVATGLTLNAAGALARVTVFTNSSTGSFPGSTTITLPQPRSVADLVPLVLADLTPAGLATPPNTPTGHLDVLLPYTDINATFNDFIVLHNTSPVGGGAPSFAPAALYPVDNAPVALTVGNGGATNQGAITVVENGTIVNGRNGVGTNGGDINSDGIPDVLTVNIGVVVANRTGRSVTVARGVGDGTFLDATTTIETPGGTAALPINPAPAAIAVGDLNGDGIPDYVVADSAMNQVEVYLGVAPTSAGGNVTYGDPVPYSVSFTDPVTHKLSGRTPVSVALADLTGTGVLDIVTADNADSFVSILPNNGKGVFGNPTLVAVGQGPTQVIAGVFDKFGGGATPTKTAADLIVAHNGTGSSGTSRGVSVLLNANTGNRTFVSASVPVEYGSGNAVTAVAGGDFNADGNLDFVFTNAPLSGPGGIIFMQGDGHGNFAQVGVPISVAANPVALAVADVNRDGYEDVVVGSQSPNLNTAIGVLLNTVGDGFRPPVYTALPNNTPVNSLAVTDLPTAVTTTLASNITATATLIPITSAHGFPPTAGFNITVDSEIMTVTAINGATFTVVRGVGGTPAVSHLANAVVTAQNVPDPYPDLVVGTFPVSLTSPLPVVDNVFTLQGVGDGTFVNPLPYEAGGPPSPTTVATASDPLIRLDTFFMGGTLISSNLVQNGNFDTRDLSNEEGNLVGWTAGSIQDSHGAWNTQDVTTAGSFSPLSNVGVPRPDGLFQAMLDQSNLKPLPISSTQNNPNTAADYQGSNFLYQDVTIPANVTAATFSLRLTIHNFFTQYATGDAGATLDYRSLSPDQQVRVDLMDPTAPIAATNTDHPGSVFLTAFQSDQSTPLNTTTPIFVSPIDVSSLAGKKVRVRIAVVNNQGKLVVGVDDVALQVTYTDSGSGTNTPILADLRLRNPGYLSGATNVPTTTDPTLVGSVRDDGGINNVAFVAFEPVTASPAGGFNPADPKVFRTNYFDAQGNFSVQVPNLATGTYTFNVRVQDVAGNFADSQIVFVYQALSNSVWGAVGPGSTDTTAEANIAYGSVTGEVTATAADPSDPSGNTYLIGTANGGVWRTTDGGSNWTPLTDNLTFNGQPINTPIGALAFSPNHSNIIYAATGTGNALPTSRVSVGILMSANGGQSGSWAVVGNSNAVFGGARISQIVVAKSSTPATTPDPVYVAVASGGMFGPGVYRSLNGGQTWTNILTVASLNVPAGDVAPASIASVTSIVINTRATSQITVGLGNIGLVPNSTSGGVWISSNADTTVGAGPSWNPVLGGDSPVVLNNTLPSDLKNTPATVTIGRVTVSEGFASPSTGPGSAIATLYVLIANPSHQTPQVQGGSVDYGNGLSTDPVTGAKVAGLYKSSDGNLNFTHVMLRANTAPPGAQPAFKDINLLGNDANNVGQLVVDPTDVNVVYVGGADNAALSFGLIRVDTGNMRDVNYYTKTLDPTNDGDDITKATIAKANALVYPITGGAYTGEGVSWYDLESNAFSPDFSAAGNQEPKPAVPVARTSAFQGFSAGTLSRLPAEVEALALDNGGRLVIGTQEGAWRAVYHGTGYDYSSGGTGIVAQANQAGSPPTASVAITTINGNLQISNLTAVASDPLLRGQYYASSYDVGTTMTTGGLGWQTMGLDGPNSGLAPNTSTDAGVVLVASPDPTAPVGTPTTVFRDFAYTQFLKGYYPETSTQNGALASWGAAKSAGISIKDAAGYFPTLVIDPNKIFNSGVFQDLLLFGTDRIYKTTTSSNNWVVVGPNQPLSSAGGYITAAAISPSNTSVFYAGTNLGEVFITQNSGNWFRVGAGTLPAAQVTGISVDPNNPLVAYATFGGNGAYSHVWRTANGGGTWVSIQGNLPPNVPAYSVVTDPRPSAGAPNGHLYLGTEVGVFVSANFGASWTRFGAGSMPNVPVVNLQFNQNLNQLTAATQGRGAFVISVDYVGAHVVSVTPNTPVRPGFSSVTVTFNEAITSFPLSQVTITSPTGAVITPTAVTNVSVTPPGQSNPMTTWEIDFAPQNAPIDGVTTFKVGPNVLDLVNNPMDQNGNNINGQPGVTPTGDVFAFQVATSSTDDGQFVSGVYNDLLGRPADTNGFLNAMNILEPARFGLLPGIAVGYVASARTQLINDLYSSTGSTASTLGIANLFGVAPTGAQLTSALSALQQGASIEGLLASLVSNDQFFDLPAVAEIDSNYVTQAYTDLTGAAPTASQLSAAVTFLSNAEVTARLNVALNFVANNFYIDNYVSLGYVNYLGVAPPAGALPQWENAFHSGTTQNTFIAILMGLPAYYQNAPNIITPVGQVAPPQSQTVFIQAVYQQLFNGTPGTDTATPAEVNFWLGQFAGGVTHQQMVTSLLATDRYRQALITLDYSTYLMRAPTPTELSSWDTALAGGMPTQNLVANLFATNEFFANQFNGATRLHDQDANWVNAIFLQAGGGAPPNTSYNVALDNAEIAARSQVAQGLTSGSVYRNNLINFVYNTYDHRAPTAAETSSWLSYLAGGSTGAGALSRDEVLLANVLGSKEYFFLQTDAAGLHTNTSWANSLNPSLRLPANPAQAANTVTQLLNSYVSQRLAVVASIDTSTEYRTNVVKQDYQRFLLRAPTQAEINAWVGAFAAGFTREYEIANLIGTREFFTKAPDILNVLSPPTYTLFVQAAYRLLLPYYAVPASIYNYWVPRLQSGASTQTQFALALVSGSQYLFAVVDPTDGLVNFEYNRFTGVNATPAQIGAWQGAYTGIGYDIDNTVIINLMATPGYFLRTHKFP
jgi:hypothetical protein